MLDSVMKRARTMFAQETQAQNEKRIAEIAEQLTAEEQRDRDLVRIAEIKRSRITTESFTPEAVAIAKVVAQLVPHIRAAEEKVRVAQTACNEAQTLADRHATGDVLGMPGPAPAARRISAAVGRALVDAGASDLVDHLGWWLDCGIGSIDQESAK